MAVEDLAHGVDHRAPLLVRLHGDDELLLQPTVVVLELGYAGSKLVGVDAGVLEGADEIGVGGGHDVVSFE